MLVRPHVPGGDPGGLVSGPEAPLDFLHPGTQHRLLLLPHATHHGARLAVLRIRVLQAGRRAGNMGSTTGGGNGSGEHKGG